MSDIDVNQTFTPHFSNDQKIRKIGFLIVLVTFGVFGVWAFFAPIDSSAMASGTVVVKSYKKTVQHFDGGIISKIFVKDGDLVTENQPLIILDDTQIKAQLEIARSQNIALAAKVARLEAERDQIKKIQYPDFLLNMNDPRILAARQAEDNLFNSRKSSYEGEISLLEKRISQIGSKITGLQEQVDSKKQLIASYKEEINDLNELLKEGFADKIRLREFERSYAMQMGEIGNLNAEIATNQMMISETRLQILQTQKQFQEQVAEKLSEAQTQLNDAIEHVTASQDKLNRVVIKAPTDGLVLGLTVHTENAVITPGSPILDIVPQNTDLIVEAKVSPMDIDKVSVGLNAEVRFSSFKQKTTPQVFGKVVHVSADSFTNDKNESFYIARIELTPESLKDLSSLQLVPGMPADVLIKTGERTLVEYLTKPISDALNRSLIED